MINISSGASNTNLTSNPIAPLVGAKQQTDSTRRKALQGDSSHHRASHSLSLPAVLKRHNHVVNHNQTVHLDDQQRAQKHGALMRARVVRALC
eukprot:6194569-Pleurochrysis_carterae.AAC.2